MTKYEMIDYNFETFPPNEFTLSFILKIKRNHVFNIAYKAAIKKFKKDNGIDFRLLLVGEGHQRKYLENLSAKLELTDRIVLTGSVPYEEVGDYISAGDIFVISSIYEGLPRALIEATYLGKSVVVTNCGGIPDFFQLFNHGYIVPPNNPQALAVKMEKLLRDDETRTMFEGKALKIRDENIFDWDYAVEQYDGVYKQIFNSE